MSQHGQAPARGRQEGGSRGSAAHLRIPHVPEDAGSGLGQDEGRSEVGAGNAPAPNPEDDSELYAKAVTEDKLEAQGMFLELLFRGRKAAEPDPVKNLEKTAPVTGLVQ
ncbi:MAG: hypothetical protein WCA92_06880 [Terriglobales bacterium]